MLNALMMMNVHAHALCGQLGCNFNKEKVSVAIKIHLASGVSWKQMALVCTLHGKIFHVLCY